MPAFQTQNYRVVQRRVESLNTWWAIERQDGERDPRAVNGYWNFDRLEWAQREAELLQACDDQTLSEYADEQCVYWARRYAAYPIERLREQWDIMDDHYGPDYTLEPDRSIWVQVNWAIRLGILQRYAT